MRPVWGGECSDGSRERDEDGRVCVVRGEDFSLQVKTLADIFD